MANPLLALQVQPSNIDVAGSLARGQEMQTARLGNLLTQYKLQQEQAKAQQTNSLAALYNEIGPGLASGDEAEREIAINRLAPHDPEAALGYREKAATLRKSTADANKSDLDLALGRAEFIGRTAAAILEAPEPARPLLYQRALQQAKDLGVDVAGAPQQYDENAVRNMMDQAVSVKDQLAAQHQAKIDSPAYKGQVAGEEAKARGPYENPIEVYDSTSPSGTRLRRPDDAVGQPGKPGSGMRLTTNADGTVELVQGPGAGIGGGLGRAAQTTVQTKILNAGDTLAAVSALKARAKPEYQTIGTRWGNLTTAWKEKGGLGVDPKDQAALDDFSEYRATGAQLFSQTLKDLSGLAITEAEMKRAEGWIPNTGTGLFDGDSPTQFKSKSDRFEDFTKKALAKYQYINKHGLDVDAVDVDAMPKIMQRRGDDIAKKYESQGLKGPALTNAVKGTLAEEFGLGVR